MMQLGSNQVVRASPGFTWHEKPTKLLISLYGDKKAGLDNPHIKKKMVWGEIAEALAEHGYRVTGSQVENKVKALVNAYKRAKDSNKQSGNGRKSSPYYEDLDKILQDSPDITPVSGASSLQGYFTHQDPSGIQELEGDGIEEPASASSSSLPPPASSGLLKSSRKKKRLPEEEPLWAKEHRAQRQRNHVERMDMQREFFNLMKDLLHNK